MNQGGTSAHLATQNDGQHSRTKWVKASDSPSKPAELNVGVRRLKEATQYAMRKTLQAVFKPNKTHITNGEEEKRVDSGKTKIGGDNESIQKALQCGEKPAKTDNEKWLRGQ
jgi:hypothetical protein